MLVLVLLAAFWLGLDQAGRRGWLGPVARTNVLEERDATPMFYTDSAYTQALLRDAREDR